jgi:hypothetical protein
MRNGRLFLRGIALLVALSVTLSVTSCGTILYPERRGQPAGRIDVGVAVLDGVGLLLFLVPGVIAFAVDFSTGAIYLPPGSARLDLDPSALQHARAIQTDPASLTRIKIEELVEQGIGQDIALAAPETRVARVVSGRDLAWCGIAEVLTPGQLAAFESEGVDTYE